MGSLSSSNRGIKYLLCVINVFTKHARLKPLKNEKVKTALQHFIEIVSESNRKPNKLWIDYGGELWNKFMKKLLEDNDISMYSNHNEAKSLVADRFISTLKGKIYKKIIANDNKSYFGYLNKLVDK